MKREVAYEEIVSINKKGGRLLEAYLLLMSKECPAQE